jgi:chemotaxis protein histidine kinase CheA
VPVAPDLDDLREIVQEFVVESHEILDQVDRDLLALEQQPDAELVRGVFRAVHTLKGTSGFLGTRASSRSRTSRRTCCPPCATGR